MTLSEIKALAASWRNLGTQSDPKVCVVLEGRLDFPTGNEQ